MKPQDLRPADEIARVKGFFHRVTAFGKYPKGSCQFPGPTPCPNPVIDSHSIQRAGPLALLKDPENKVIQFKGAFTSDLEGGPPRPTSKRVGHYEASIFNGLCNEHDTALFAPIETGAIDPGSKEHLFLLSYRAVLREWWASRVTAKVALEAGRFTVADSGAHPMAQLAGCANAYRAHVAAHWQEGFKIMLEQAYQSQKWEVLRYWTTVLPFQADVAVCSSFTPCYDFVGGEVNEFSNTRPPRRMVLVVHPMSNNATLVLTAVIPRPYDLVGLVRLLQPLEDAASPQPLGALVSELTLRNCENFVMSPTLWESFGQEKQEAIEGFFAETALTESWSPFPAVANLLSAH